MKASEEDSFYRMVTGSIFESWLFINICRKLGSEPHKYPGKGILGGKHRDCKVPGMAVCLSMLEEWQ